MIVGNWKMHKNLMEAEEFLKAFLPKTKKFKSKIVIAAPYTLLPFMKEELRGASVKLSAQNIHQEEEGAYTGEISAGMVRDFADYVIIGHSERRKYFCESDEIVNRKIQVALKHKLRVIFCLGETLEQRESAKTSEVVKTQLELGLKGVKDIKDIIIAYEPVWAIGTGNTATPELAQEVHNLLRGHLEKLYNKKTARSTKIIYGGSVNPDNAKSILAMPDIDGCLPGGASLDPEKFLAIIKALPQ